MRKRSLLLVAALVTAGAHGAGAVPYAFATVSFTNLSLTGLASGTIDGATVTTSSSASYNDLGDAAAGGPKSPGTGATPLKAGSDVRQSVAGAGLFPLQNVFGQRLTDGAGTRGDAVLLGNLLTGSPKGSGAGAVEGRLIDFGQAASSGGTTTGFNYSFTRGVHTLVLTFTAAEILTATTDTDGDGAGAEASASFSILGPGFTDFFAPLELNASVSSSGGTGDASYNLAPKVFTHTVTLTKPGTYQISLSSGVQERLSSAPADSGGGPPTDVPEPPSLALLLGGLIALFPVRALRRRRSRTYA